MDLWEIDCEDCWLELVQDRAKWRAFGISGVESSDYCSVVKLFGNTGCPT
jgi:hypothetical protein